MDVLLLLLQQLDKRLRAGAEQGAGQGARRGRARCRPRAGAWPGWPTRVVQRGESTMWRKGTPSGKFRVLAAAEQRTIAALA